MVRLRYQTATSYLKELTLNPNLYLSPTPSTGDTAEGAISTLSGVMKADDNAKALATQADWSEHEHVSAQVQLEAEKLVQLVGTPELAKYAISVVEQQQQHLLTEGPDGRESLVDNRLATTFLKALTDFETSLATPVVSGELMDWAVNALQAGEEVTKLLVGRMQHTHADLFSSIKAENLDLVSQVDRATDVQLSTVDCNDVVSGLTLLLGAARSAQQDEGKLSSLMADVVKRGMKFIVEARSQETRIATWTGEALNRDLGSGD